MFQIIQNWVIHCILCTINKDIKEFKEILNRAIYYYQTQYGIQVM